MKFETIVKQTKKNQLREYAKAIQVSSGLATWSDGFRLIQHKTPLDDGIWTFSEGVPTRSDIRYPQHGNLWTAKDEAISIPVPNTLLKQLKPSAKSKCLAVYDVDGQFWSVREKKGLIPERHVAFDVQFLCELCETPWDYSQIKDEVLHLFSDAGSRAMLTNIKIE